jgi:hypothetical protein
MTAEAVNVASTVANGYFRSVDTTDKIPALDVSIGSLVPGVYLRQAGTDMAHAQLLADAAWSTSLPPILVQKTGLRIIDGMHRLEAAKLRGKTHISARVVDCTDEEAFILAVQSNTLHGLPLSKADRIAGAKRILASHPDWSDRAVASVSGLSAKTVGVLRNRSTGDVPVLAKRLGRDGKKHPVSGTEGRLRAVEYIKAHPDAPLRQVAREADVSLGTVHDVRDRLRRGADPLIGRREAIRQQGPLGPGQHQAGADSDDTGLAGPVSSGDRTGPAGRTGLASLVGPGHPAGPDGAHPIVPRSMDVRLAEADASESRQDTPSPIDAARGIGAANGANAVNGATGIRNGVRPVVWRSISGKLAGDPTLRYTEGGRAFLRWMSLHAAHTEDWREFVDVIPVHWLRDVDQLASSLSEEWRMFAEWLRGKRESAS